MLSTEHIVKESICLVYLLHLSSFTEVIDNS